MNIAIIISVIISILSIIISVAALYLTHLRNADIQVHLGPEIRLYHVDYDLGLSTGIYLPAVFLNSGAKVGTILRTALTIESENSPHESFFMQWRNFAYLDSVNHKWVCEEVAHALTIPSKSSVNKIIWFIWSNESKPNLTFEAGSYLVTFYYWDCLDSLPKYSKHKIILSRDVSSVLQAFRNARKSDTVDILLDKELELNRLLTKHERKTLLGV
jgi:hypothetical protein